MTPAGAIQKAQQAPQLLAPRDVLHLQRTIGNRAVARLLASTRSSHQRSSEGQRETQPDTTGPDTLHTVAPAQPTPSQPVLQREVFQKTNGKFYSDLDPSQEFDTYQEALDFEKDMEPPPPISGGRSATLFTYISTLSHRKMSSRGIPQGPHTVGHAAVETALYSSEGNIKLEHLIAEQVRSPAEWRDIINKEFGKDMFDGKSELSIRILRAYQGYNGLYQELMRVLAKQSDENAYDLVHELIQLDPYTVYKFTKHKSVTKKHLKHKGENRDLSDPKNIDTHAKFKDQAKYLETVDDRLSLIDYDYTSGEDSESSSDNESMEEEQRSIVINQSLYFFSPDEVPNDGNCFFQSLINLGRGASVQALRTLAKNNGGQANIDQDGIWANEQDITAVANALGIRIGVASLNLNYKPIQAKVYGNGGPLVPLAHIFGGHFVPLRN